MLCSSAAMTCSAKKLVGLANGGAAPRSTTRLCVLHHEAARFVAQVALARPNAQEGRTGAHHIAAHDARERGGCSMQLHSDVFITWAARHGSWAADRYCAARCSVNRLTSVSTSSTVRVAVGGDLPNCACRRSRSPPNTSCCDDGQGPVG